MPKMTNGARLVWAALFAASMRAAAEFGVVGVEAAEHAVHDADRGLDALRDLVQYDDLLDPATRRFSHVTEVLNG